MAPFPCSSERTAASALLLLTVTPPPPQPPKGGFDDGGESSVVRSELGKSEITNFGEQSFVSGDSKSCCTSLLARSSEETQARTIRMITLAALHRDVKLRAVQKNRSKIQTGVTFNSWRTRSGVKVAMTTSFASTSSESSCLSTSSSAAYSSARSRHSYEPKLAGSWSRLASIGEHTRKIKKQKKKTKKVGSANIRRKADAILKLLSQGCLSEVKIRQTLGDSPDTSKALRLLLKFEEVKRTGAGGRRSPYIYTIA
ncbi:PREDICTED: uncharacterized protein LOC101296598 [Fragaria vesca subsp. vesca]|uniref:uncharacterized protein LOC101296598 n=1 Tax=Fragaria vesca subsp. vesca TaxID=101020 RepID=UPI0002C2F754|nr:PREDICTED: uncharacterized protein LOC101296598 [Fragaria vesca subsp. vesca]